MNAKISNPAQLCSVRQMYFSGGREGNERVLLVENGRLSFTVLADRALDIYDLRYRGENISFLSKTDFVRSAEPLKTSFRADFYIPADLKKWAAAICPCTEVCTIFLHSSPLCSAMKTAS